MHDEGQQIAWALERIRAEVSGIGTTVTIAGWVAIWALVGSSCSTTKDVQALIAACDQQAQLHKVDASYSTCMSASGYDFMWEDPACGFSQFGSASCYEQRGPWRSAKLKVRDLYDQYLRKAPSGN